MRSTLRRFDRVILSTVYLIISGITVNAADVPGNFAPKAKVTVSTAYSDEYKAEFMADGIVPDPMGYADVAEDGSAYFKVPAEKPIYFIAMDEKGRGLRRMRSFTHLMPGEVQGRNGSPYISWIPTYNGHEWNINEIAAKQWSSPASKLSEIILGGHADADGKPQIDMDEGAKRRILTWIDLNVPYYGTAATAHPNLPACRQMLPTKLRSTMDDVYARRCQNCHDAERVKILTPWRGSSWGEVGLRIENPRLDDFLLAPLAKSAGGTQRCGKPVFASTDDPDLKAVLETFKPIHELLKEVPRMDMPGAVPCCCSQP